MFFESMRILNAFLSLVLILFFTTACSTIVENNLQSKQEVLVESVPSDSDIYMDGEFIGKTPMVLRLRSDLNHEIYFQKEGYKPTVKHLNPIQKYEKQPYVQWGLAKDFGHYYKLSSDHVIAEMYWDSLPNTVGITPYEAMSELIAKADNAMSSGNLTLGEHKIIIRQIIELFNSN